MTEQVTQPSLDIYVRLPGVADNVNKQTGYGKAVRIRRGLSISRYAARIRAESVLLFERITAFLIAFYEYSELMRPRALKQAGDIMLLAATAFADILVDGWRGFHREVLRPMERALDAVGRLITSRRLLAFALTAMCLVIVDSFIIGIGLEVSVNGEPIGFISQKSAFEAVIDKVESKASHILGYNYNLDLSVSYSLSAHDPQDLLDESDAEKLLFSQISEIKQLYTVTLDGEVIGAVDNADKINTMLDDMLRTTKEKYSANTAKFCKDLSIQYQYTDADYYMSAGDMANRLSSFVRNAKQHTVAEGETSAQIALDYGITLDTLKRLNADTDLSALSAGDTLCVQYALPLLSVQAERTEIVQEAIPYSTVYVQDNTLYKGSTVVKSKGVPGVKEVTMSVTFENDLETARTVTNEKVIAEPQTEVVRIGTKVRGVATRNFKIPYHGTVTSTYGYRTLRGRSNFHTGIDFAGPRGSSIVASDGGTVTFAGWKGSYGYLVIIDHKNGFSTYYAHCSKLLVSAGQKVAQGELIAKVGSTGNSTGSHCHFEIHYYGKTVNPAKYLW